MVQQNLFLCLLFSALGGAFAIAATAVVVLGIKAKRKAVDDANRGKRKALVALTNQARNSSNQLAETV